MRFVPRFRVGQRVRLIRRPRWTDVMPPETRRVIEHCVGKAFRIDRIEEGGVLYVLDVSGEVDARFGGFANDVHVEAEYLEPVDVPPGDPGPPASR